MKVLIKICIVKIFSDFLCVCVFSGRYGDDICRALNLWEIKENCKGWTIQYVL